MFKVREIGDAFSSTQLIRKGPDVRMHLLCAAQSQEADLELLELKEDVVHSGVGVAGQQDTEAAGVQNPHLRGTRGITGPLSVSVIHHELPFLLIHCSKHVFIFHRSNQTLDKGSAFSV